MIDSIMMVESYSPGSHSDPVCTTVLQRAPPRQLERGAGGYGQIAMVWLVRQGLFPDGKSRNPILIPRDQMSQAAVVGVGIPENEETPQQQYV